MVRVLLLAGIMLIFAGTATWAVASNPWIRTCRIEEGQFWVLKAGSEEYSMCFFGNAAVGAEALFMFKAKTGSTEAVQAYKNRNASSARGGVCGSFDAEVVQAKDSEGQTFNLCKFSDNSLMEETTLWMGPGSDDNQGLDKALSKTY
ncbi:hypothetical protein EZJ49_10460 [Bdellovibrio bacteriovorus]|uniref:hypothetical protein n=1 Tax=Bdellovibrio bacteriovorus TaxID=959 RepID=UPI0021CFEFB2|nr:hypothetical protein [Bdellovibrio bacteriovorus]UXR63496.1 hypothetical protein EZJ49_10460 [Bdellovibrio bacteriovorus]